MAKNRPPVMNTPPAVWSSSTSVVFKEPSVEPLFDAKSLMETVEKQRKMIDELTCRVEDLEDHIY